MTLILEYVVFMAAAAAIVGLGKTRLLIEDDADKNEILTKAAIGAGVEFLVCILADQLSKTAVTAAGQAPQNNDWHSYELQQSATQPGSLNFFELVVLFPLFLFAATAVENKAVCWGIAGAVSLLSLRTAGGLAPDILSGRQ